MDVGQQMVGQQHRLGVLQVGHARHRGAAVTLGDVDQSPSEVGDGVDESAAVVAQIQPQVRGDLVVATPAGTQPAAQLAETLQQAAFQRRVDVLVVGAGHESPVSDVGRETVQPVQHAAEFLVGEQPGRMQHSGVRPGRGEVVRREPPVDVHGSRQPGQLG